MPRPIQPKEAAVKAVSSGIGEFELIDRIRWLLDAAGAGSGAREDLVVGPGDDAAVTVPRGAQVISVDSFVEGVHFRRSTFPLRSVGHKALAAALSDLAAMGAEAREAYVQLGVPEGLGEAECLELAEGLAGMAAETRVAIAGGDVTRAPCLLLAVTAVGRLDVPGEAVTRGGARPGDVLAVTGALGGAAAGLLLLERPELAGGLPDGQAETLRRRQLEPVPRLEAGQALARAGARAMIDLSDGLGGDAGHVGRASGARLVVELERLPVAEAVAEVAARSGIEPLDLVLSGGEDYELLVALPPDATAPAAEAVGATGARLSIIGRVEAGRGAVFLDRDGRARPAAGFDQLRPRPAPGEAG